MKTQRFCIRSDRQRSEIEQAAAILKRGGLVAMPTETVYGLAANALDGNAVRAIFAAKGRPQDNPLIVHISSLEEMEPLVKTADARVSLLAAAFWPGPLTIILPKSERIPFETSGGLSTIALRVPAHPVARALIAAAGFPLAAPSANSSGKPSPTTAAHVLADLDGKIDAVIDGGTCAVGIESTVLSLAEPVPRLLRPGGTSHVQLEEVLGEVALDSAVFAKPKDNRQVSSPGMKYRHYAPQARVTLVRGNAAEFAAYVRRQRKKQNAVFAMCFTEDIPFLKEPFLCYGGKADAATQAQQLFAVLRQADELAAQSVLVHCPAQEGIGLAVYNRLLRAAAFRIVEL